MATTDRRARKTGVALHSDVDVLSALRQTQVLIECLSTDTKIPGHLAFLLAISYTEFHLSDLFAVERFLAATIGSLLFCKLNPFPLPLTDQCPLKFSECAHDWQHQAKRHSKSGISNGIYSPIILMSTRFFLLPSNSP